MTQLNRLCDNHDHEPGLPDRDMRAHILDVALRAAEAAMTAHGINVERSVEILHVAVEDVLDEVHDDDVSGLH